MHDGIIPATPILAEVERSMSGKMGRELVLRKALKDARWALWKNPDRLTGSCVPSVSTATEFCLIVSSQTRSRRLIR